MAAVQKFVVLPFVRRKGRLVAAQMRPCETEESARRRAELLAPRNAGVLALAVMVDPDTDDMFDPRELARHGDVIELDAA